MVSQGLRNILANTEAQILEYKFLGNVSLKKCCNLFRNRVTWLEIGLCVDYNKPYRKHNLMPAELFDPFMDALPERLGWSTAERTDEQEKSEQPLFSLERFRENLEALRAEEADAERKVGDVVQEERGLFKKGKGRIRELQDMREQLAETELKLMQQQVELDRSEQSVEVLLEELELERKLRGLLTKEKEKAVEEASLALGLCSQGTLLP